MKVAIVKPDWGIVGGAELVVDQFHQHLLRAGHEVHRVDLAAGGYGGSAYGIEPPEEVRALSPEFFRHAALLEAFERVDVGGADLVVSAQPPAYAASHSRHLCLFFHHARIFYDLADVYIEGGWVDPDLHRAACDYVRLIDDQVMGGVDRFLANSEHVKQRLADFNGLEDVVGVFHGGIGQAESLAATLESASRDHVLCVSRNEFTKRTEVFVHAMKYLPDERGVLVGGGGRLPWVRHVDAMLERRERELDEWTAAELWLRNDKWGVLEEPVHSNVEFPGRVSDEDLARLYSTALCVVAPSYLEDYGMTALEAMRYGRPAVVCRDGGGLVDLIDHEVTGLVVEPTGRAIADAVRRLRDDVDLWRELSGNASAKADDYRWERAHAEFDAAVEEVMSR